MSLLPHDSNPVFSGNIRKELKNQLSALQKELVKKRIEKRFDDVELLEQEIDLLHKKLLVFRSK